MKILYNIAAISNSGGMERVLANKSNWLSNNGYEVIIVTTDQKGKPAFFSMNEGNYYSRVIENNEILIYDRLSYEEESEFISNLDLNEYEEV